MTKRNGGRGLSTRKHELATICCISDLKPPHHSLQQISMSGGFVTLRNFSEHELNFDDAETKDILKFFFQHHRQRIDAATVTTALRNFAQGLLVEALDATYALGYVEILLTTFYNPGSGMKKVLMKAGRKAARHWFKHATDRDLHNAKVADAVRRQLSYAFATSMREILDGVALGRTVRKTFLAHIQYGHPSKLNTMWG
ncbi:MAG: hypothetical protein RBT39_18450 [Azoarcus sp.]|nr:hypothetical protein [Azoarcus sp.]